MLHFSIFVFRFFFSKMFLYIDIQGVPLATETGISLIIFPVMRILQRLQTHTTDTFLFISHTTYVLLFKFRCNIFIGVRIIKEMPGSIASGTLCILLTVIGFKPGGRCKYSTHLHTNNTQNNTMKQNTTHT